jgi:DNA-binding NtrC family response regulator
MSQGEGDAHRTTQLHRDGGDAGPVARIGLLVFHRAGAELVPLREGEPVVVGRVPPADVIIPDGSLSKRHARFVLEGGHVSVEDLGSTNGTRLRGVPVERATLGLGDEVSLGAVTVTVHTSARSSPLILAGHDRFCAQLAEEATRARFFQRGFAAAWVRAGRGADGQARAWADGLQAALRPVDRVGLYGDEVLEILFPEASTEEAAELLRPLLGPGLAVGVAGFPLAAASPEELLAAGVSALRRATAAEPLQLAAPRAPRTFQAASGPEPAAPVSASPAMRALLDTARRVSRGAVAVLFVGETGSGKEVLARYLHEQSPRRARPLVCVNCAAIAPSLLESTLFGHEKGAFTGALQQQKGVFEAADGGTVFLDEVGELPPAAQAALLRVLETKRVSRVGSTRELPVDTRVVAATHRDLEAMCDRGAFRQDLLYRLNAVTLRIPPLRERREDIPVLVERFLEASIAEVGSAVRGIDPEALELLVAHTWPGNVRELRNVIERAVVIARDESVTLDDLPDRVRAGASRPTKAPSAQGPGALSVAQLDGDFRARMDRLEAAVLGHALEAAGWNQTETARRLEMPLRTLVHKIREHGLKKPG